MKKELSVIIPAYNEEKIIQKTLKNVKEVVKKITSFYEIIVVDDGSNDRTFLKVVKISKRDPKIKAIKNPKNMGKGFAFKNGFFHSQGKLIVLIDADLEIPPNQIPYFLKLMKKFNADIIIGSKYHPLSKVNFPLKRRVLSKLYQLLIKILFNLKIRDTQTGLKVFKRNVLKKVLPKVLCKRYAFDLEILAIANYFNYKIIEAPVKINWKREKNRIKIKDILNIFVDTLAIFYRLKLIRYYQRV